MASAFFSTDIIDEFKIDVLTLRPKAMVDEAVVICQRSELPDFTGVH
jgi:hypothetical protein